MILSEPFALVRTVVVGVLAYLALVAILRVSGKRTLSQLNAFDFIVTVALGSTLATILISKDVTFVQGVVAFLVLVGMQFAITWTSLRSSRVARAAKSEPTVVVREGRFLDAPMRRERLLEEEVMAALRRKGIGRIDEAEAVVLETDGSISVLTEVGDSVSPRASASAGEGVASVGPDR